MPFCKYCGKKLSENEVCNCQNQKSKYTPDIDLDSINQNTDTSATQKTKVKSKKRFISNDWITFNGTWINWCNPSSFTHDALFTFSISLFCKRFGSL